MLHDLGCTPVYLHPRQRFPEDGAVRERALRAHAGTQVPQTALEPEDLPEPLDVAAGERQTPESRGIACGKQPAAVQ